MVALLEMVIAMAEVAEDCVDEEEEEDVAGGELPRMEGLLLK
jgi:hypothetical protein